MMYRDYMPYNIIVPQSEQKILLRRGITDFIDNASLEEMVYFIAPYGSGKTMAVLSWLKNREKNAAWVNLSEKEDTPESFFAYFTSAILMYVGEREEAENIFKNPQFIENPRGFLNGTLIRVSPALKERILVIDNFQHIKNRGLLREIKKLLINMLGCWRIIIMSRSELPPIFSDFMLKKQLRLITLKNLNFNLDEIKEYFLLNGLAVEKNDITQICYDTNGWAAALNAVLTVPHNGIVKYNDTVKEYVIGYFESEIMEGLTGRIKEFLLKTSILDKLIPSICYYLTEMEDTQEILKNLYVSGIFLVKEERDTYSYQRAFREFLSDKLNRSGIDVNSLYIKAGWWLYERNESILSLLCFYHAKFLHGINMAFKKVKPAYMGMDEYIETTFCLTSLDVLGLKDHPEVAARIALLHFLAGNITEMQRIYKIILEWFEPGLIDISQEEYIDLFWEIGWLRYVNPDEDILFNPEFDKWVNVKEYAPHLLENDRARASTLRLPSLLSGVRDFSVDVEKALKFYEKNNVTQNSIRDDAGLLVIDIIYAEICYERENFEQAEKTIKRIMPLIELEKYTELYFSCIALLVKITRAVHDSKEIDKLTGCLKTQIETNGHFFLLPNFNAFELRNRISSGIPGLTEEFQKKNELYKEKAYYYLIYRHITYVRALLSESNYTEASLMLGTLEYMLRQYKRNMDLIEVNILRAVTEYGLDHKTDALHYLKMALDDGRKCGFIRIFADDAVLLYPVLNLIYKRDSDEYIEKIKTSCKFMLERAGVLCRLDKAEYIHLTNKEVEILKMLQTDLTCKEIAVSQNLKQGTVKGHIHNIYSKLNVKNRTSAILTAIKNGII